MQLLGCAALQPASQLGGLIVSKLPSSRLFGLALWLTRSLSPFPRRPRTRENLTKMSFPRRGIKLILVLSEQIMSLWEASLLRSGAVVGPHTLPKMFMTTHRLAGQRRRCLNLPQLLLRLQSQRPGLVMFVCLVCGVSVALLLQSRF